MRTLAVASLIAAIPATVMAEVTFFSDLAEFELFNDDQGYTLGIGTETFEENTMGTGEMHAHDDPLVQGVANGWFPTGLDHNIRIQSNTLGGNGDAESPRGTEGLIAVALGAGFGEVSDIVLANYLSDSFDLILPVGANHRSICFDALTLYGDPLNIRVYGQNNALLGETSVDGNPAGIFIGLGLDAAAEGQIARINMYAPETDAEGADNINVYVPEPTALALLAVTGLFVLRRR